MHRLIKIRVIRDLDRLDEHLRGRLGHLFEIHKTSATFLPHADLFETTQGLVLRLDLAGVAAEDVSLSLAGHELVIRGRRRPPPPEGLRRFMHLEIPFGSFERRFMLPIPIDPERVEARYVDGILEVQLPRRTPQSRQIPVKPAPVAD